MKTFNDNANRTWTVAVNIEGIKRVRSLLGVDLMEAVEGKLIERLIGDPVLLCDVIYCLCRDAAEARGITDVDFGRAMAGDAIELATAALLEELVDFFPHGKRQLLRKALAKLDTLQRTLLATIEQRLDDPEFERQLQAQLQRLGDSSGAAPGSSASPPAP